MELYLCGFLPKISLSLIVKKKKKREREREKERDLLRDTVYNF